MENKTIITKDTPPDVIERDIARTRKEMSSTIDEIGERLSARHWKEMAREKMQDKVNTASSRVKELADKAGKSMRSFGQAAIDKSQIARDRFPGFMKDNQAAALVLAFELGAWIVIAFKGLAKRNRGMQMKKLPGQTDYARAKIMPIEEVEQKVKNAALAPESKFKKAA